MRELTLAISPCPNDTFAFHALVHGLVEVPGVRIRTVLEDVETLNQLAARGEPELCKVSYGALPHLLGSYLPLRSGGALGRGCGPLLVSPRQLARADLAGARILSPGARTTAHLLFRLWAPEAPEPEPLPYDRIMPAIAAGEADAGLIIHESRFTYADHGLRRVVDLGEWWEAEAGAPLPLGAVVARRSLGEELVGRLDAAVRASVEAALADPSASEAYVRRHAREMSPRVIRSHIGLYVTEQTAGLDAEGERAVRALLERAPGAGAAGAGSLFLPRPG